MLGDHHARKTIESACQYQGMSDNLKGGAAILLGYIQQLKAVARRAILWKKRPSERVWANQGPSTVACEIAQTSWDLQICADSPPASGSKAKPERARMIHFGKFPAHRVKNCYSQA
jgi:hypothetical protein